MSAANEWRTDIENSPEGEFVLCYEIYHNYPLTMKRENEKWYCDNDGCEHEPPRCFATINYAGDGLF